MKLRFLIPLLAIFISPSAIAADFTATIDNNHIKAGQRFTLSLTLSGARARSTPDINTLKQSFTVVSEYPLPATGANHSTAGWRLTLMPRRAGHLVVPAVTVATEPGILRTAPIPLEVDRASPQPSLSSAYDDIVSISAKASTETPYRNQSIQYTVTCVVRGSISDVSLSDLSVNNAIVEQQGDPDIHDQAENGRIVRVVRFHYIITPLQSGKITVPPLVLRGKMEPPRPAVVTDPFGGRFVFSVNPQVMNVFSVFGGESFTIASNQTVLSVRPPANSMNPWLPLASLEIKQDIDTSQPIRVGEPMTRKITLRAEGAVGSQLPDVGKQLDDEDFRAYANTPTMGESINAKTGAIFGWREESYNIIPQKAGQLVLPAIKVLWWDTVHHVAATAEVPERALNVLPAAARNPAVAGAAGGSQTTSVRAPAPVQSFWAKIWSWIDRPPLLYGFVIVLVGLVLFAVLWGRRSLRKIGHMEMDERAAGAPKPRRPLTASKPNSGLALKHVHTAEELREFLRSYAQDRVGVSKNASLESIFAALPNSWAGADRDDVEIIVKGIGAVLYAGKTVDMDDLKRRCRRVIVRLNTDARGNRTTERKLPRLNPD